MLSLFLGGGYPYVTGRDTGASAIASEAGVGPTRVDDVIIVYKSFITRVGAGPLPGEISKEEALKRGWFEVPLEQAETDAAHPSTSTWQKKPPK